MAKTGRRSRRETPGAPPEPTPEELAAHFNPPPAEAGNDLLTRYNAARAKRGEAPLNEAQAARLGKTILTGDSGVSETRSVEAQPELVVPDQEGLRFLGIKELRAVHKELVHRTLSITPDAESKKYHDALARVHHELAINRGIIIPSIEDAQQAEGEVTEAVAQEMGSSKNDFDLFVPGSEALSKLSAETLQALRNDIQRRITNTKNADARRNYESMLERVDATLAHDHGEMPGGHIPEQATADRHAALEEQFRGLTTMAALEGYRAAIEQAKARALQDENPEGVQRNDATLAEIDAEIERRRANMQMVERQTDALVAPAREQDASMIPSETPSTELERIPEGPTPLDVARQAYASALRKYSRAAFGTSKTELDRLAAAYEAEVKSDKQRHLEMLKARYGGRSLTEAEQAECNAAITEYLLNTRFAEETKVRDLMREEQERSLGNKFTAWWKKSRKGRMVVSFALTGGAVGSALTGNFLMAGAFQGMKAAVSGVGTTLGSEAAIRIAGEKFGATKERTAEEIEAMDLAQLERLMAHHSFMYADDAAQQEFGVKRRGVLKRHDDETGRILQAAYERKRQERLRQKISELHGRTPEEVTVELLTESLNGDIDSMTKTQRDVRHHDRRFNQKKWLGAVALGASVGGLTGVRALGNVREGLEHGQPEMMAAHAPEEKKGFWKTLQSIFRTKNEDGLDVAERGSTNSDALDAIRGAAGGAATEAGPGTMETAKAGDSVWSMVERYMHERHGATFEKLSAEQQTYMVDAIKDRIAANPSAYGLEDADVVTVGQHVDIGRAAEGVPYLGLTEVHEQVGQLSAEDAATIKAHNAEITAWMEAHPNEPLTTERIGEILGDPTAANTTLPDGIRNGTPAVREILSPAPVEQPAVPAVETDTIPTVIQGPNGELIIEPEAGTEAASSDVLELSGRAEVAWEKFAKVDEALREHTHDKDYERVTESLEDMRMDKIVKRFVIEQVLDKAGIDAASEKAYARDLRGLIKALPKGSFTPSEKWGDVLNRIETGMGE